MDRAENTASIVKDVCLLIRCLASDVLLLRVGSRANAYTEPLPSNGYTHYNIVVACYWRDGGKCRQISVRQRSRRSPNIRVYMCSGVWTTYSDATFSCSAFTLQKHLLNLRLSSWRPLTMIVPKFRRNLLLLPDYTVSHPTPRYTPDSNMLQHPGFWGHRPVARRGIRITGLWKMYQWQYKRYWSASRCGGNSIHIRFGVWVLSTATVRSSVFWDVPPWSPEEVHRRFETLVKFRMFCLPLVSNCLLPWDTLWDTEAGGICSSETAIIFYQTTRSYTPCSYLFATRHESPSMKSLTFWVVMSFSKTVYGCARVMIRPWRWRKYVSPEPSVNILSCAGGVRSRGI
jgi:hypothetical protein